MTATPTTNNCLDIAIDRLIDDAAGFRSREPRDRPVLVRFTSAELRLLDALAADKAITRIDLLRRLIDSGVGKLGVGHHLAVATINLLKRIRTLGLVKSIGGQITAADEALEEFAPVSRKLPRREARK